MIELLMGAHVVDADGYERYRAEMKPLLEAHGGSFSVDAIVAEVLRPTEARRVNRLFTIRFPSLESMEAFFALDAYRAIRRRLFDRSVAEIRELGRYVVVGGEPRQGAAASPPSS